MTQKEIEDYINKYRVYPPEYTGVRDNKILRTLDWSFEYKDGFVTCLNGKIDEEGNYNLSHFIKYHISDPDTKIDVTSSLRTDHAIKSYNYYVNKLNEQSKMIIPGEQNDNWTLRDMVAEIDYLRSTFYDVNHERNKLRAINPRKFIDTVETLRVFIRQYRPYITDIKATVKHGSKYDT